MKNIEMHNQTKLSKQRHEMVCRMNKVKYETKEEIERIKAKVDIILDHLGLEYEESPRLIVKNDIESKIKRQ
jgi:hypothetical protein